MSDPRYRVERRVGAPPEAVLAAIREGFRTTRTSDVPVSLRKRGIRGVYGKVRGPRFRVGLEQRGEGEDTDLAGHVVPDGNGGSRVQASARDRAGEPAFALGCIAAAAGLAIFTGDRSWWWLAVFGVVIGILAERRRMAGAIHHDEARFLADWLNRVLDRLPAALDAPPIRPETSPADPAHAR